MAQIHKRFTDDQVKNLLIRYLEKEVERKHIQEILRIKKARFFRMLKKYRTDLENYSVQYTRNIKTRSIDSTIEKNIIKELKIDKKAIQNKEIPLRYYNYSYVKDRLETKYKQKVSLPTIIDRARKNDFYLPKKKKKIHDREVLTNYAGELIQHDSSHHLWAPAAKEKWYLITSIDDFSRVILYADLFKRETAWAHILALETLILRHGCPFKYYVDSHSIFRFVRGRDELWLKHHKLTDESTPQWKQVLFDCNVKVIYALSPQAKGKVERPYGWLQDRLIRTCIRENVTDIKQAQKILNQELRRYNHRQVHSTTQEVPSIRFQKALNENNSLFREFNILPPYQSTKDIFCLRIDRTIDSYRKISINNLQLKINNAVPREKVTLRIYPLNKSLSEVRFWSNGKLLDVQNIKNRDLPGVYF
jgi:hypothetical protein